MIRTTAAPGRATPRPRRIERALEPDARGRGAVPREAAAPRRLALRRVLRGDRGLGGARRRGERRAGARRGERLRREPRRDVRGERALPRVDLVARAAP